MAVKLAGIKDEEARLLLRALWTYANKPDSNLGVASVGPSPQKITLASAVRLLEGCDLSPSSVFLDIGSGHGLIPMCASIGFGCEARGIEVEPHKFKFSLAALRQVTGNAPTKLPFFKYGVRCTFEYGDICDRKKLSEDITHLYCFDKDFPPAVTAHLKSLLIAHRGWRVFISSRPPQFWNFSMNPETADLLATFERYKSIVLSGSGQSHVFYMYRRS